jgi:hypothetical protein
MDGGFGIESHAEHPARPQRKPARCLVVIDSAGSAVARLFVDTREQVAEFDASAEEVAVMTKGLVPVKGASGTDWDGALDGHSAAERAEADVYTLDI